MEDEKLLCSKCGELKTTDNFCFRNADKKVRHKTCRSCNRQSQHNHYIRNRQRYIDQAREKHLANKNKAECFVIDYLKSHPCIDCGESDIVVLEFDHRSDKKASISSMIANGFSMKAIGNEISKCDVRCANCHRRKTAMQIGYYKVDS